MCKFMRGCVYFKTLKLGAKCHTYVYVCLSAVQLLRRWQLQRLRLIYMSLEDKLLQNHTIVCITIKQFSLNSSTCWTKLCGYLLFLF